MAFRSVAALAAISFSLSVMLCASGAQAAEIVVFSSTAAKSPLEGIAPAFEHDTKHKVSLRFAPAASLKAEIEKGAACDVALLTVAAIDDLIKQGRLAQDSRTLVAKSGIGIAVAKGNALPPVKTVEELKQALLAAKSVAYTAQGATGTIVKKIFERLGIADAMSAKTVLTKGSAPEAVAAGQAEMAFTQISEILDVPAARLVSPLPAEVQSYTAFAAAASAGAKDPGAARAFIAALTAPAGKAAFKTAGLEPN